MKNAKRILLALAVVSLLASCSNSYKSCAAYDNVQVEDKK